MSIEIDVRAVRAALINDGYVVFRKVVPVELCEAVLDAIGGELHIWVDDPESWDRISAEIEEVPLRGHQSQWDIRQLPDLHAIWSTVWGTERLWVDRNSCRYTPPWREGRAEPLPLHWDVDPHDPDVLWYQGILALTHAPAGAGGFCCSPSADAQPGALADLVDQLPLRRGVPSRCSRGTRSHGGSTRRGRPLGLRQPSAARHRPKHRRLATGRLRSPDVSRGLTGRGGREHRRSPGRRRTPMVEVEARARSRRTWASRRAHRPRKAPPGDGDPVVGVGEPVPDGTLDRCATRRVRPRSPGMSP